MTGVVLLTLAASGCASAPPPEAPPIDAGAVQGAAERASAPDRPYRVVFAWEFQEPGVRVRGRGVARIEPPYRARLDLFSSNGERLAAAALVGDELRVPAGMMAVPIPPPPMLWGALGVFRPGTGLFGATATRPDALRTVIRYRSAEGGELVASLSGNRLARLERSAEEGIREDLQLRFGMSDERFPREAVYRDHASVRELRLTVESIEHVESHPPDVWSPDGPR